MCFIEYIESSDDKYLSSEEIRNRINHAMHFYPVNDPYVSSTQRIILPLDLLDIVDLFGIPNNNDPNPRPTQRPRLS